jgi:GNAT superfamily N-acetyltransferase
VRLSLRLATADDAAFVAEILYADPGTESVALLGSAELAREYGKRLVELEEIPSPTRITVVAETPDRAIVGVLQYTRGAGGGHGRLAHLRILLQLIGPIGVLRRLPHMRGRTRVEIPVPPEAMRIATLYVDPNHQSGGVGRALLDWAEEEARRIGADRLVVVTLVTSAAIPWYERRGFVCTRTATDPSYERYLGAPGRVLLEKPVPRDPA